MNVDELMSLERQLTDEEFVFLEQELLKTTREFHAHACRIADEIESKDPALAEQLRRSARKTLVNVEEAAAIPLSPPPLQPAAN